jgi:hypothetical protein
MMKMVYSNENSFIVNNVKNLLESQGIKAFIKNEFAQGAVGEISAFDAWPEVWVTDECDFDSAMEMVTSVQSKQATVDWTCKNCAEKNDASFDLCWQCQNEKP